MYKIYINETALFLMKTKDLGPEWMEANNQLVSRYPNNPKFLLSHIDMMEKTQRFDRVLIHASDIGKLWKDFKQLFKVIKAAGGLVFTEKGKVLAIYRQGYWDLPKGKIDKGEGKQAAALREVMEETGIQSLELESKLLKTYHLYKDSRYGRVLKKTFWYRMKGNEETLTPQAEEAIEKAVWMMPEDLLAQRPIYQNIIDVIRTSKD